MASEKIKSKKSERHDDNFVEVLQRIGVGLLYSSTDLGQNSIAQIMDMSDGAVNGILKGIKKPSKKK